MQALVPKLSRNGHGDIGGVTARQGGLGRSLRRRHVAREAFPAESELAADAGTGMGRGRLGPERVARRASGEGAFAVGGPAGGVDRPAEPGPAGIDPGRLVVEIGVAEAGQFTRNLLAV